jgi:hypothetical protein
MWAAGCWDAPAGGPSLAVGGRGHRAMRAGGSAEQSTHAGCRRRRRSGQGRPQWRLLAGRRAATGLRSLGAVPPVEPRPTGHARRPSCNGAAQPRPRHGRRGWLRSPRQGRGLGQGWLSRAPARLESRRPKGAAWDTWQDRKPEPMVRISIAEDMKHMSIVTLSSLGPSGAVWR